ncbi:MAG: hypothetical protein SFU98_08880 [Leptospiraceae bacterium]|nr:hypothetical protein [Leptospiraceae bacterium]
MKDYIFLESYRPHETTLSIAQEIGNIILFSNIPTIQSIKPYSIEESKENVYSKYFGFGEFPLHSDLAHWYIPPKYLLLRCIVPAPEVFTTLIEWNNLFHNINDDTIHNALFKPRRKVLERKFFLRLIQNQGFELVKRWDSLFLEPENQSARNIVEKIKNLENPNLDIKKFSFNNKGDTLIINNWKMLHGRTKIDTNSKNRLIERVYFSGINYGTK